MSIHTSVRTASAIAGIAVAGLLVGCSSTTDAPTEEQTSDSTPTTEDQSSNEDATSGGDAAADSEGDAATDAAGAYADGTYTATGSYQSPGGQESVEVTLGIEGDLVSSVEVVGDTNNPNSQRYQGEFISGIADEVVGVAVDDLNVDTVAGSSLTSGGFNDALESIKADAAS